MNENNRFLPTYKGCIVCGEKDTNPNTLNVRFRIVEDGVEVPFTPDYRQEGYKGIVHGGVITSLLDETIGWAVAVKIKKYFVTGELNIRFIKPLPIGTNVIVKGRVIEHKSRYSIASGEITDSTGQVFARAEGKFVPMPDEHAQKVRNYLTFREDDVDILNL